MSLYSLNKDMLIQLILERDNFEKLNDEEIIEKRKELKAILLKRKADKLDSNVEHKEFIQKYREYFLSALVSEKEINSRHYNIDKIVKIKLNIGKIRIYFRKERINDINYTPNESKKGNHILRDIAMELEEYEKRFCNLLKIFKFFLKKIFLKIIKYIFSIEKNMLNRGDNINYFR